jgi:hypothetical protein
MGEGMVFEGGRLDLLVFRGRASPGLLRCPVGSEHRLQAIDPIGIQASGLSPDQNTTLLRRMGGRLIIIEVPIAVFPARHTIHHDTLIRGGGGHFYTNDMGGLRRNFTNVMCQT